MKKPKSVCIASRITQVVWKNKTKAKNKQGAFRVRMSRNVDGSPLKADRLFDTLRADLSRFGPHCTEIAFA
ncbi:hypothetical protein [Paraburkholderia hayleyella]|uniref:hypothetical protein n=1 Tax=Paraburkholderia hayleyella TaxID=2152889 RepID=UPI0012916557|nr:hypothetical protein [Paraburkholderia hayleyella]